MKQQLSSMEFGRRVALEHELQKSDHYTFCNISEWDLEIVISLLWFDLRLLMYIHMDLAVI